MFFLTSSHHFEYYTKACDRWKGFDSLCELVRNELNRDPISGELFVFMNCSCNTIKLLHWEAEGLVIYHKRLEKGTLSIPKLKPGESKLQWPNLVLMVERIIV